MADDNDKPRRLPWSREADKTLAKIGAAAGVLLAIGGSYTGVVRVDRFGLSDHLLSVKEERFITRNEIRAGIDRHEDERAIILHRLEKRFDAIEHTDTLISSSAKVCRELLVIQQERINRIEKKVDDFQRRKYEHSE